MSSTEPAQPLGLVSSAQLGLVERLRLERRPTRWTRGVDTDYPIGWEPHLLCAEAADELVSLRGQLQTLGKWIAEALTMLDTVEPEDTTEAELLTALIRRGEMLVLSSLARGGALGPNTKGKS